jgi:hypothetical protein
MATLEYADIRFEEPFLDASAVLGRWGFAHGSEPFLGRWEAHHPWSIPGPLYVGDDDACGTGPAAAPNNVCLHDEGGEFLFRQPSTEYELRQLVNAARSNAVAEYACDGNMRWTPEAVAAWWESIQPVREKLRETVSGHDEEVRRILKAMAEGRWLREFDVERNRLQEIGPTSALRRWLDYLDHGAEAYLRRYVFFLSTGRVPTMDEHALPELKTQR